MGKVIVYVESLDWLGHAETQQEYFVKMMLVQGWRVIILTRWPQQTARWAQGLNSSHLARLFIYSLPAEPASIIQKIFKWRYVNNQVHQAEKQSGWSANIVFISWLDGMRHTFFKALFMRFEFKYAWVGLYFLPAHFRADVKINGLLKFQKALADAALIRFGRCRGIGVLDEGIRLGWVSGENKVPVVFFPEITETEIVSTAEINAIREQAKGRCIFGLLGALAPRKGVLNFLRLAKDFDPEKGFFLLAGKFDINIFPVQERSEIQQLLQTAGRDNCCFRLQHIGSAQEFNALIDICDVLYLAYQNHYFSSGLLAKAALFHKPVIVTRGFCLGERVKKYNLGMTVASESYPELLLAAQDLAETACREAITLGSGFAEYNEQNSAAALQLALRQLLNGD